MNDLRDTKAIRRALEGSLEDAMRIAVEDLLGRAVRDAPVDEGTLRGSGTATVEVHGQEVIGKVTFGTPYARAQHEGLDFEHPKGGKAKYLESNLTALAPRYKKILAASARKALDRGR
jgi:hypothetical protein